MSQVIDYISLLGPLQMAGLAGFVCYIGAFGSVQIGILDGNSMAYSLANIVAALLVAISLLAEFNLATALIQISWIIIGALGLFLRARKSWTAAREVFATTLETEGN